MTPNKLKTLCRKHGLDITSGSPGAAKHRERIARIMFCSSQTILNYANGVRSIDPARYKLLGIEFGDEAAIRDADRFGGRY